MLSLFSNHKRLTLYVLTCLILLGVYVIFASFIQDNPASVTNDSLTAYQKTSINKTTEAEVKTIPGIKKTTKKSETQTEYRIQSQSPLRDNVIITEQGKVIYEKSITGSSQNPHPQLAAFIAMYGEPEQKVQGSKTYGEFETFYIYASRGFTLIANPFTGEIDEIQSYTPTTPAEYLSIWGSDYAPETRQHQEEAEYRP